jgi:hypothetical protein
MEAYMKKKYDLRFVAKVTDSDMENSETRSCLDYSLSLICLSEGSAFMSDPQLFHFE